MQVLLFQTGQWAQCLAAARETVRRYPNAALTGVIHACDIGRAQASGLFASLRTAPSDPSHPSSLAASDGRPDLCVLPFEDRFGVRYWAYRWLPVRLRIPRTASLNRLGRWSERTRPVLIAETLVACVVLRALQIGLFWLRNQIRRWIDVPGIFVLALAARAKKMLGPGRCSAGEKVGTRDEAGRRRLVVFIPSLGVGGAQRQVVAFLANLDRSRWDPEVVTLYFSDSYFEPAVRGLGVPIVFLNGQEAPWMCEVALRLVRHLRAHPCEVLHGWLHYAAGIGAIAGTLVGTPVVVGSLRSERPGRFPWFYSRWQRALDVLTGPLHSYLIANSNAVREENRRWAFLPDRKLLTIYNGVDLETAELSPEERGRLQAELHLSPSAPVVGIVGRLYPEKDHGTFLRAARQIAHARPDVRFLIVGEGASRLSIETEVRRLGLTGEVHVLGHRDDARSLIQMMTVLVMTSTSEGLPNVLLEAAVAGVPIVTTAAGGAAEVVVDQETGFVVPCGDADAVAQRVSAVLDDPGLRQRFAAAGRDRVKRLFSAPEMATAIEASYMRHVVS